MASKQIPKPKCPACGSGQVYLRLSSGEHVCRMCGNKFKASVKQTQKA